MHVIRQISVCVIPKNSGWFLAVKRSHMRIRTGDLELTLVELYFEKSSTKLTSEENPQYPKTECETYFGKDCRSAEVDTSTEERQLYCFFSRTMGKNRLSIGAIKTGNTKASSKLMTGEKCSRVYLYTF